MARMIKKQVHAFYAGHVQGVGFRLTAEETANHYGVVGWIRNLRDGRVELVAEADEEVLKQFLGAIRTGPMGKFIRSAEVTWSSATGEFQEFEIRYC